MYPKTTPAMEFLLRRWHAALGLARQSPRAWHVARLREELRERRAAITFWHRVSETADVYFAISRARHDGYPLRNLPAVFVFSSRSSPALTYAYMLVKYTLRWTFYRAAGALCGGRGGGGGGGGGGVREVVNPAKDHKLVEVASRHQIDPELFRRIGCRLRRVWPLLP